MRKKRTWKHLAPALAAGPESDPELQIVPAAAPVTSAVYPAEVRESEENGVHRIEEVYYLTHRGLSAKEQNVYPAGHAEKRSKRDGQQKHIKVVTANSSTDDMTEIIQQLEPALKVTTEDGYSGVLSPDYPGIKVEAAGCKTSSRTVTASRGYSNLSNVGVSLIPKTISKVGRTMTLADAQWQEAEGTTTAEK